MPWLDLVEIDSLEAHVLIDNDLDPMSTIAPDTVQVSGMMGHLAMDSPRHLDDRGDAHRELRMEDICCSAHGLSILLTATKGDQKHSVLFDAGPEEEAWERNVRRMRPDLSSVELVQLSHWHRDHSGGLPRAIRMINDAKEANGRPKDLIIDLHSNRPDFRGFAIGENIISLQADPSFEELEAAGATIQKNDNAHTVLDDFFLISGEIPRRTRYETGLKNGMRFDKKDDEWTSDEAIADERFIMCNIKDKGVVMLTGCSHAGVVNCAQHALELAGGSIPLHAVIGGFHLATSDATQIESSIKDLLKLDPAVLLPGHCTGWRAKFAIEKRQPGMLVPCSAQEHRLYDIFSTCFEKGNPSSPNCVESNLFGSFRVNKTREPEHLKAVLTGNFADFGKGERFYGCSRNLIRPMFIKCRISDLDIFERKIQTMLSVYSPSGEPTDVMDLLYRMTLERYHRTSAWKGRQRSRNPTSRCRLGFCKVQRIQTILAMTG
ncbi:beta-lactamase-like protein [Aspergillus varians]